MPFSTLGCDVWTNSQFWKYVLCIYVLNENRWWNLKLNFQLNIVIETATEKSCEKTRKITEKFSSYFSFS